MTTSTTKPITTLFLDAGEVLFSTGLRDYTRISAVLESRGYPQEAIARGIRQANAFYTSVVSTGRLIREWQAEKELWSRYYSLIAEEVDPADAALQDELFWLSHYVQHCKLFEEVRETLERLTGRYRLAVISNAFPSTDWVFDRLDIRRFFERIVLSAFVGVNKPDPRIFRLAMDEMKVTPGESLFVDDQQANIDAAAQLGMHTWHLVRPDNDLRLLLSRLE